MATENKKKKKKKRKNNSALALGIVVTFGIAAAITVIVADSTPRNGQTADNPADITEELPVTTASEVTTVTTESTETTTTTTAPLPEGSVESLTLSFYNAVMKLGDDTLMPLVTMYPEDALDKSELWESSDTAVATVDDIGRISPVGAGTCIIRVTSVNNPAVFAEVSVTVADPNAPATAKRQTELGSTTETEAVPPDDEIEGLEVIDGITYIQGVMIVNKTYSLPASYNPGGLLPETQEAFAELQAAAQEDGLTMNAVSAFRSYEAQETLYNNYVARDGKEAADRYSARAGHSEHQSGYTIDVNYAGDAFHETPEAKWLAENCWKYGFIIRFPEGKEAVTGYKYESWHIRFVGKEMAKNIYDSGLCLEEYFGIDSKYAE